MARIAVTMKYVKNQIIVCINNAQDVQYIKEKYNLELQQSMNPTYVFRILDDIDAKDIVDTIYSEECVHRAELNMLMSFTLS